MGGFKLAHSLLHATLLFFFAGSLVGASVKCPSKDRAELTRNTKEYVLVCGYPTKASTILKHSNIENAEDCADLCSKNSRCVHAEWRPSEKTCSLKSAGSIAVAGETVYNWRKKGTELDFEDDEASFPELESDEEGFGESEQGFGESEQGFGGSEQGFGESEQGFGGSEQGFGGSEQGFGGSEQGFGGSEQGFGESEQGFGGSEQGFTDPDERSTDPEEGFTDPGPGTGEKDLPSSCPAALAGFGIEKTVRESMEVCCPDASAEHEALIKDYMAIVNNALSLIARYCEKSCEPQAPLCFGLPVYPEVVQTAGATAALKDLPQTSLVKGDHVFDFDTLLGPVKPDFELYSSQRAMTPRQNYAGKTYYMIRAGTKASDLQYIASEPTELRYHASCSEDIPCIYKTEKPWTSFGLDSKTELALDFSAYEVDMVLSVADVWGTLEQYAVFVEGKEIGRTHGALSLKARGQDPYDPEMMPKDHVGEIPDGPSKTIIGRGFWGSFKIPKGTKLVVIKMIYPTDLKGGGAYRIDRGCN